MLDASNVVPHGGSIANQPPTMRTVTPRRRCMNIRSTLARWTITRTARRPTTRNSLDNTHRPALIAAGAAQLLLPPHQE